MTIWEAIKLWSGWNKLQDQLKEVNWMNFSPGSINGITNIIALSLAILEPLKSYLTSQPFQWETFAITMLGAVTAFFTGRGAMFIQKTNGGK